MALAPAPLQAAGPPTVPVNLGDRVVVNVSTTFTPIVPLVNLPSFPITSSAARTIFKDVEGERDTPSCVSHQHGYPHGYAHAYPHFYVHANPDQHSDADEYADAHRYPDADARPFFDADCNQHKDADDNLYTDEHTD